MQLDYDIPGHPDKILHFLPSKFGRSKTIQILSRKKPRKVLSQLFLSYRIEKVDEVFFRMEVIKNLISEADRRAKVNG